VYDNKSVNANERVDLNALKTGAYYYTITNETGESAIGKLIIW
jgi:hypothetical protein